MDDKYLEVTYSVHNFDKDGDMVGQGVYLDIGDVVTVRVAKDVEGFLKFSEKVSELARMAKKYHG